MTWLLITIAAVLTTLGAFVAAAFGWGYIEGRLQLRRERKRNAS